MPSSRQEEKSYSKIKDYSSNAPIAREDDRFERNSESQSLGNLGEPAHSRPTLGKTWSSQRKHFIIKQDK